MFESLHLKICKSSNYCNDCATDKKIVKPESRLKAELAALLELGHPGGGEPDALNHDDYQQS